MIHANERRAKLLTSSWPGKSAKRVLHAGSRRCPGHPRLCIRESKAWMPGTRPGMTSRWSRLFVSYALRGRWQAAEQLFQREADRDQAAVAARGAVELEPDRQLARSPQGDRNLQARHAGIAAGIGVLDEEQKILQAG